MNKQRTNSQEIIVPFNNFLMRKHKTQLSAKLKRAGGTRIGVDLG